MEIVIKPDSSRHGVKSEIKAECRHSEIDSMGKCAGCGAHHILQPDKGIIDLNGLIRRIDKGLNISIKEAKNGSDKDSA